MKVRDMIRLLESNGWTMMRQSSSHRVFKKAGNPNTVVVPGHDGDDVPRGIESQVKRKAGL